MAVSTGKLLNKNANATNGVGTDGIYLLNSMNCTLSYNKVSCATYGNGTLAVEVQESPFNTVSCNEIEGADCGLVFAGSCNPNEVSENFLGNHKLGLVLVTRATGGDGIIGPQTHRGNHLTGCGINKDAVNYGLPNVVLFSQFLVSPNVPYLPNNIQELVQQQWFLNPQTGNEYSCSTNNTCPGGFGARSSKSSEDYRLYNSIYNSSIGLNEFDDARTWSARKNILEFIKSRKSTTSEEQLWLRKYKGTALDLFSDIGSFCSKYFDEGSSNHQIIESYINDLKELSNSTTYEIFQKKVSLIRLKYLENKRPIEEYEVSLLKDIANLCPYEYGNAVYEARMMLSSSYPVIVNEQNLCGIKDQKPAGSNDDEKSVTVYPNPSNNVLQIILNGNPERLIYRGKVIDLFGRPVIEFSIKEILEIPVSELNPGLYLITIGSYKEANTKVLIQR